MVAPYWKCSRAFRLFYQHEVFSTACMVAALRLQCSEHCRCLYTVLLMREFYAYPSARTSRVGVVWSNHQNTEKDTYHART